MKNEHDALKSSLEGMAGFPRHELYAILRTKGLSAIDALALAAEVQNESVAHTRRSGFLEIFFGTIFVVGAAVVLAFKSMPLSRGGFVIVLAGLAGVTMMISGLPKVTLTRDACERVTHAGTDAASDARKNLFRKKRPSAQVFSVCFGSITILFGIAWWLMFAE